MLSAGAGARRRAEMDSTSVAAVAAVHRLLFAMQYREITFLYNVQLLGIPSLSAGILEAWQANNNPSGAIALALITLLIVLVLVAFTLQGRPTSCRTSKSSTRRPQVSLPLGLKWRILAFSNASTQKTPSQSLVVRANAARLTIV